MAVTKQTTFCFLSDRCDGTPAGLRPEWQQVTSSGWGGGQILLNKDVRPIFVRFSPPSICGNKPETGKQSASATTSFPFTVHQELLLYERKGWMWCQHKVIVILFEQVCGVLLKGECGWAAGSSQCRAVHAITRTHRVYCHNNRVWRQLSQRAAPIYPVRWTRAVLPRYLTPSWNTAWKNTHAENSASSPAVHAATEAAQQPRLSPALASHRQHCCWPASEERRQAGDPSSAPEGQSHPSVLPGQGMLWFTSRAAEVIEDKRGDIAWIARGCSEQLDDSSVHLQHRSLLCVKSAAKVADCKPGNSALVLSLACP